MTWTLKGHKTQEMARRAPYSYIFRDKKKLTTRVKTKGNVHKFINSHCHPLKCKDIPYSNVHLLIEDMEMKNVSRDTIVKIRRDRISPNPAQTRINFDEEGLLELAERIWVLKMPIFEM